MIRLSASAIKDWLSCQKKYYYRVNFPEKAIKSNSLLIGGIVHTVLEKSWEDKYDAYKLAYNICKSNSYSKAIESSSIKFINNFFRYFRQLVSKNDIVEKFFELPYDKDIVMVGKYDRIINDKIIYDWKTSRYIPKEIGSDIQFIIYYESFNKEYGYYPELFFGGLYNGSIVKYRPSEIHTKVLYNEIIPNMIEDIYRGDFPRTGLHTYSFGKVNCYYCQFKKYCMKELEKE